MSPKKQLLKSLYQQLHKLLNIQESLDSIMREDIEMALDPSIQAILTAVDDASNGIAARIQRLLDQIAAGGLTPEAKAAFDAEITKLVALGKDPVIQTT